MSRGSIPVAILGSDTFDARTVDVATPRSGPDGASPAHKKSRHLDEVNGDGLADLVSHYRVQEAGIAFGDTEACVTGETLDGAPLEGCGSVRTVAPGGGIGIEMTLLLPGSICARRWGVRGEDQRAETSSYP